MAEEKPIIEPEVAAAFDEGKPVYYSNAMHLNTGLHDMRISFGKRNPYGPVSYDVHVYLSLPAAKQLQIMLMDMVENYERNFGAIKLEPISGE